MGFEGMTIKSAAEQETANDNEVMEKPLPPGEELLEQTPGLMEGRVEEERQAEEQKLALARESIERAYPAAPKEPIYRLEDLHFSRADRQFLGEYFGGAAVFTKADIPGWKKKVEQDLAAHDQQSMWEKAKDYARNPGKKDRLLRIHKVLEEVEEIADKR